jgi:hypothetical protein
MKSMKLFTNLILASAILMCFSSKGNAQCISPGDFGPGTVSESFENTLGLPNTNVTFDLIIPGVGGPVTFSSGLVYNGPLQGGTSAIGEYNIADYNVRPTGGYSFLGGSVTNADDVPFGDAFFLNFFVSAADPAAEFLLPYPVDRVGFYLLGSATLRAYDSGDNLVGTCSKSGTTVPEWGQASSFIGVEGADIVRIEVDFGGGFDAIDQVIFEGAIPGAPIPTMSQWALFLFGLIIINLGVVFALNVNALKQQA